MFPRSPTESVDLGTHGQADVAAHQDVMATCREHAPGQCRRRGLPLRSGDRDDPAAQPVGRKLQLASDRHTRPARGVDHRCLRRDAWTQHDEVGCGQRRRLVPAKFQRDASLSQTFLVLDRRTHVRERDRGATPDEQLCRGDAAACRAHHDDPLATNGEGRAGHRSFNVVRLKSAKMIAMIRKRVMTFGSLQPISSKW